MGVAPVQLMGHLFLFGTLLDDALRAIVCGASVAGAEAVLDGYSIQRAQGGDYPVLQRKPGAQAKGLLLRDLSQDQLDRFHFYESGFGYVPSEHSVLMGGHRVQAVLYMPETPQDPAQVAWSLPAWQKDWAPLTRHAAIEVMSYFGAIDGPGLRARMPPIRTRAASKVAAERAAMPRDLRADLGRDQVVVQEFRRPYSQFFTIDEIVLTHPTFDGGTSAPLTRAAFVMADAVTVLPYDPGRDRVLLVEQFRTGPFARGDRYPWSLEPIAGRIDPGETAEEAARREAVEESHLHLQQLLPIATCYPSPGAVTEYLRMFVGLADLPDDVAGLGGAEAEGEDIRSHILSFDALMGLFSSGEMDNGPLITSALWLDRQRAAKAFD